MAMWVTAAGSSAMWVGRGPMWVGGMGDGGAVGEVGIAAAGGDVAVGGEAVWRGVLPGGAVGERDGGAGGVAGGAAEEAL